MADFDFVFLICSERAGSNLIRVMADAHPQITAPPPMHILRNVVGYFDAVAIQGKASEAWPVLRRRLRRAMNRYYGKALSKKVIERIDTLTEFSAGAVTRTIYEGIAEQNSSRVIFIKENNIQRVTMHIMDCFPEAKFVFQVRDPRDCLASAKKLRTFRFGNKFGSNLRAVEVWREDQGTGLMALGQLGPERVFLQRYEDLIADPQAVLTGLCAFLGLPFCKEMLDFHEQEDTVKVSKMGRQWENLGKAVMSSNAGRYREVLSERDIKTVETYLGPYLRRFGYHRDYPKLDKPGLRDVFWPMLMDPIERYFNKEYSPFLLHGSKGHKKKVAATADVLSFTYASGASQHTKTTEQVALEKPRGAQTTALERVLDAAADHGRSTALSVGGESWTYDELLGAASAIAEDLGAGLFSTRKSVVGIYADRHWTAYAGVLATLMRGATYVPINPRFPAERNRAILSRAGITHLICADADLETVENLVADDGADNARPALICLPDTKALLEARLEAVAFSHKERRLPASALSDFAYILFTSGSTGEPKGVAITQGNLAGYLDAALTNLKPSPSDRFSQTFDLTFDLSVHDMFMSWSCGAHLVVASRDDLKKPAEYIRREGITQWFSVPSLAYQVRLQGGLNDGAFPSLGTSIFCGEALPMDLAQAWLAASPNGRVENWYGPTEATIACTRYAISADTEATGGIAPIGTAFKGMQTLLLADNLTAVADGEPGELFLGGCQISNGYLNDPRRTAKSFVCVPGHDGIFYRTGDRAVMRDGVVHFLGRVDNQVKVRGYRIELGDIENALRSATGGSNVVAFAWPPEDPIGKYIVCAVESAPRDINGLIEDLRERLPDYMVPTNAYFFDAFFSNASGKVDRKAIAREIAAQMEADGVTELGADAETEQRLLQALREINPALTEERIRQSENLIAAGLDSFGFVRLTLELEQSFGLELSQDRVVDLSTIPFGDLVDVVLSKTGETILPRKLGRLTKRTKRTNRAIQFVEKLPFLLEQKGSPLTLVIGSSGVQRGFSPSVFDALSVEAGTPNRAVNIGMPALSCRGMVTICRYIRDVCVDAGVRPATIIYELDPMQVSKKPAKGDVELDSAVFEGKIHSAPEGSIHPEFEWSQKHRGAVEFTFKKLNQEHPKWAIVRDTKIADCYAGRRDFKAQAVADWAAGAEPLTEITDDLVGFIHPLNGYESLNSEPEETNLLTAMVTELRDKVGIDFLLPQDFQIAENQYLNINHVDPRDGMANLTTQIFERLRARPDAASPGSARLPTSVTFSGKD